MGGADDRLRMSHGRRRAEGVTQRMVDRCILDKIADFLNDVAQHRTSLDDVTPAKHSSPRKIKSVIGSGRVTSGHEYDDAGNADAQELHCQSSQPHVSGVNMLPAEQKHVVRRKKRSNVTLSTKHTSPMSVELAPVAPSRAVLDQHASAAVRENLLTSLPLSSPISSSIYNLQSCTAPLLKPTLTGFPVATAGNWTLASNSSMMPASAQFHQLLANLSTAIIPEVTNSMSSTAQSDGKNLEGT